MLAVVHNVSAYWENRKNIWLLSYCFGIVLCDGDLYKNNLKMLVWTNLSTRNRFSQFRTDIVQLVRPLLDFTSLFRLDFNCTNVSGHTITEKDCRGHLVAFLWCQLQKCVWSGMHYCPHYKTTCMDESWLDGQIPVHPQYSLHLEPLRDTLY